jgi:soluble lytic murein transglycosylase
MARPSESIPIPRPSCGTKFAGKKLAAGLFSAAGVSLLLCLAAAAATPPEANRSGKTQVSEKQLEESARALKQKDAPSAYAKLSTIAMQKNTGILGLRAALALGYYDYNKAKYADAAKWLARAQADPLLRDYSLYWTAETNIALGHNAEALAQLKELRRDFPDSAITEQALASLGSAALAINHPDEVIAALDGYALTTEKPELLFLRAQARERAGLGVEAAADYQTIYLRYPTSDPSREAGFKLAYLRSALGGKVPPIPIDERLAHAATIFGTKDWNEARNEYARMLPELTGADRERAELRILICGMALGAGPREVIPLQISDPDVDAERYFALANWYRNLQQGTELITAVEKAIERAPASHWAEVSLFLAGNYLWVQLDRAGAASYYKKLADNFPTSPDATAAQWRVAWVAVLKRQPEAAELLADHLRRFPGSQFTPDAVYWLGRLAEESGNAALARGYYRKLQERFPQNYFQGIAAGRLQTLGPGEDADPDVLASIPPVTSVTPIGGTIPPAAAERQARADALHSIGLDASAELELRAAYAATGEPRLLLEAAQAAVNAGHCGAAIATVRQIYPQLESRPFAQVPREAWLAAYPLPFESFIRRWSSKAGIDPMLTAGLIRQESAFEPEARSPANAEGLMQVLPKTGRRLAMQAKVRYSRGQLLDPDFNIHLGTIYVAGLRKDFGSVESALAAYNAGEERLTSWTAGQNYREPAEFVDSIPFTETREYVEIVTRNAGIYRKLYGEQNESGNATTGPHR